MEVRPSVSVKRTKCTQIPQSVSSEDLSTFNMCVFPLICQYKKVKIVILELECSTSGTKIKFLRDGEFIFEYSITEMAKEFDLNWLNTFKYESHQKSDQQQTVMKSLSALINPYFHDLINMKRNSSPKMEFPPRHNKWDTHPHQMCEVLQRYFKSSTNDPSVTKVKQLLIKLVETWRRNPEEVLKLKVCELNELKSMCNVSYFRPSLVRFITSTRVQIHEQVLPFIDGDEVLAQNEVLAQRDVLARVEVEVELNKSSKGVSMVSTFQPSDGELKVSINFNQNKNGSMKRSTLGHSRCISETQLATYERVVETQLAFPVDVWDHREKKQRLETQVGDRPTPLAPESVSYDRQMYMVLVSMYNQHHHNVKPCVRVEKDAYNFGMWLMKIDKHRQFTFDELIDIQTRHGWNIFGHGDVQEHRIRDGYLCRLSSAQGPNSTRRMVSIPVITRNDDKKSLWSANPDLMATLRFVIDPLGGCQHPTFVVQFKNQLDNQFKIINTAKSLLFAQDIMPPWAIVLFFMLKSKGDSASTRGDSASIENPFTTTFRLDDIPENGKSAFTQNHYGIWSDHNEYKLFVKCGEGYRISDDIKPTLQMFRAQFAQIGIQLPKYPF